MAVLVQEPGGSTAAQWQCYLLRFGSSSCTLRDAIAELVRCLANGIVKWIQIKAHMSCRLIALDNNQANFYSLTSYIVSIALFYASHWHLTFELRKVPFNVLPKRMHKLQRSGSPAISMQCVHSYNQARSGFP